MKNNSEPVERYNNFKKNLGEKLKEGFLKD